MAMKVLDSWAVIALFNEEPAADDVEKILHAAASGRHTLLMHVINWGEIYYTTMRRGGESVARSIAADIGQMPITIVEATNFESSAKLPCSRRQKSFPMLIALVPLWRNCAELNLSRAIQNLRRSKVS